MDMAENLWYMGLALEEADKAYKKNEVPIGAIVVSQSQGILAKTFNLKESTYDPCGHAELLALAKAGLSQSNWRLTDCNIYVTLEPCPMCLSAMVQARIDTLVFGAYDLKGGALSLGYNLHNNPKLNHHFKIMGGVKHYACSNVLSTFFREKRSGFKQKY